MILSYTIRVYPNETQKKLCAKMLGGCRFVYNQYIGYNMERYNNGKKFVKWTEYRQIIKDMRNDSFPWLKELNKHSLDFSVKCANTAFERFFKGISGFPHFKSKKQPVDSFYLDANDAIAFYDKHVKIPFLGRIRASNIEYIPKNKHIMGVTVKKDLDQYYVIYRIVVDKEDLDLSKYDENFKDYGYGIDIGIKKYLTISDSYYDTYQFNSFLNNKNILKMEEKIKYFQKLISNKMEINYGRLLNDYLTKHNGEEPSVNIKNILKGESYSNNCRYLQNKISRLHRDIKLIKEDFINKIIIKMVKIKPEFITIETLDIRDMLSNDSSTNLHDYIQKSKFYDFFNKLKFKCYIYNIELRMANKYFASSKKCCICGNKKKDLKLSDRIYKCNKCGNIMDRDINASINLVDLKKYTIFNY